MPNIYFQVQNGEVVSWSESSAGGTEYLIEISDLSLEKLKNNQKVTITGLTPPAVPSISFSETRPQEIQRLRDELQEKIDDETVTVVDVANLLIKLIP